MIKRKGFAIGLAASQAIIILPLLFWLFQHTPIAYAADLNVNTFTDASDGSCIDDTCSLRDAISVAMPNDSIFLPAGSYVLSLGQISVAKTINLIGQGATAANTIIDGNNADRLFSITSGTVTFTNLTLQDGQPASGNGGAIATSGVGSITLDNAIVQENISLGNGGGIFLASGVLNIINGSQILSNTAVVGNNSGGGIYTQQGTISLTDSTVTDNSAQFGGGIYLNQAAAQLTINNSQILNNQGLAAMINSFTGGGVNTGAGSVIMNSGLISGNTAFRGAGALVGSGSFTLNGGTITDNESDYGGGFYVVGSNALLTINGGSVTGNRSIASIFGGGALYIFQGHVVQNGGEINDNTAVNFGGAMEVRFGSFEMNGGTISGNSADNWGGAIYNDQGFITLTNGTLTNNYSRLGGGAIATGGSSNNLISNSVIYTNSTSITQTGGAILNTGTLTLTSVTLSDNFAEEGGGLHNEGIATLTNVTIYENTAVSNGGGLHENGGTLNVVNSIIASNSASTGPDCAGTIVSQGYNLIQDATGCTVSGSTTGNVSGDPLLAALALNGGTTLNHAIGSSSPALDVGDNSSCASTDQRGFPRPIDGDNNATIICDIGAFELGIPLEISDAAIIEGDNGSKLATFTVTLAAASPSTVSVDYATSDDTTVAPDDYLAKSGQLTFTPGDTEEIITITINGDETDEYDETFLVTLSNPSNANLSDDTAQGTITNDDTAPMLSIANTSVTEGDSGTTTATFTVALSAFSGKTVEVNFDTADDTAVTPTDYVAASSSVSFTPGDTQEIINITVNADLTDEDAESFFVNLSGASNATFNDSQASGTITDDDDPPNISIDDISVSEGNSGSSNATFTVSLDEASGKIVTVDYETLADSAAAGTDYTITSETITFTPGSDSETITIAVTGDTIDEDDETFFVNLSNETNASLADSQGEATITDDDAPPTISIDDVTVVEGDSGTGTAVFTASLSHASSKIITVDVDSTDSTATAGDDYTAVSDSLIFNPGGPLSQTVSVTINGDEAQEGNETFLLALGSPTNATLGDGEATGTITDDDGFFVYIPFVVSP